MPVALMQAGCADLLTPRIQPILDLVRRYPNLYLNTGHGTLGWTMAAGSGKAIAEIVSGRTPDVDFAFAQA